MAALAGRKVRIKYDADGAGAGVPAVIAGAKVDTGSITREGIDVTDKDDSGVRTMLDEVGTWSMDMTVTGVLKDTTLLTLAANKTSFKASFVLDIDGIGEFSGEYGINAFEVSGEEGPNAGTFSCTLASAGANTYTAD